jgi:hydroxylamine reductase (hybrid-cluster protein)
MSENMNENLNQENQEVKTEELKNEAKETINQVKENLKNVDVKEEAKVVKGFIKELIKNPLDKIAEIAQDGAKFFKTSIVLLMGVSRSALWTNLYTQLFLSCGTQS